MEESFNGHLFAITSEKNKSIGVKLIDINKDKIHSVAKLLFSNTWKLTNKSIKFTGEYKPEYDESLFIEEYKLNERIIKAIKNPLSVDRLLIKNEDIDHIKAIFIANNTEDKFKIVFQKFKKSQYLKHNFWKIFWDKNTISSIASPGINITDVVDCYFENDILYFQSYYIANSVLDLSKYYREATKAELVKFSKNPLIDVGDKDGFYENTAKSIRQKIAKVLDSGILDNISIDKIKEYAKTVKVPLKISNNRVIFPSGSKEQKEILKLLSDDIYIGYFSEKIYETNSKKSTN